MTKVLTGRLRVKTNEGIHNVKYNKDRMAHCSNSAEMLRVENSKETK